MPWYPQRTVCHADMERAAAHWRYEQLHNDKSGREFHDGTFENWSPTRSAAFPYAADDGVTIWVSPVDLDPDGTWLDGPTTNDDLDAAEGGD